METKTIKYVPADMASFKYIIEAAIKGRLNSKIDMAAPSIAVEIPEGNDFERRMEIGIHNDSVKFISVYASPADSDRDQIIAEITEKLNAAESDNERLRKEAAQNKQYWLDSVSKCSRIKEQVNAMAMLMAGICHKG